jgi:class 3 adenylate cyclase/predicted ATPase/energy-coupling factor transporter ATP-binding protein EcfA2
MMLTPLRPFLPSLRETVSAQPTLSFMEKLCHLRGIQGGGNTGSGGVFMTFDDVLAQVLALLQREGRVSYRALKLRFDISNDYIEGIKDELIYAKKLAVDEDNRVLVRTGNVEGTIDTPAPPPQSIPSTLTQATPSVEAASPVVPSRPHEAERRQLTVMFIDLVESTALSAQLDPEELREIVRTYQQVCSEVITRFDGYIAQLLGDGLLVYFGYPQAHEDDAQRAVRTGLGILAAIGDLNKGLHQAQGIQLSVRLGIHTGLVVVGEMGGQGRYENLALSAVPNVCSRIEALAAPNTIAVSDATYRLVQGYFQCQDLGAQALRGVTESMRVYQVLGESGATSRLDVAQTRGLTPLVGRESEVTLLQERWQQAKSGQGHVVLLTGDAGIGKSRLVQTLKDYVAHEPHMRWECRSSEYYQNTALFPLVELFQRLLRFEPSETPDAKLAKLEHALSQYRLLVEEFVPLLASLLSLPLPEHHYPPLNLSPQRQRQKTLETLVAILQALAEQQPMLFIVEDLHWTDPTTLELLNLVLDQTPTASMLVLLTCRSHFQPSWHHRSYLTEITVNRLSHTQVAQIVTRMTDGKTFPAEVLQQIIAKTDGVPLFVEEMVKAILESGSLTEVEGHYELVGSLSRLTIPATLQDSLMARLDRLVTAKAVAQYAAVIGRRFPYALLQAVSQLDETTLQRELGRLVEAELVYQRGLPPQATYTFKHALIQDAAYESLLKSTRQQYHQRIAQVLEAQFPETAQAQPELLAYHYTEAGLIVQAIGYWQKAGQSAVQRSAHVEAISHLTKGLALLQTLPETPERTQCAMDMHIALGASLIATKGYAAPEVGQTYTRARHLCQHLDDVHQRFPVLRGLWNYYFVRADFQSAYDLGEQLLTLVQQVHDPAMRIAAYRAFGSTLLMLGALAAAHTRFAQGIALYDPTQHRASAFRYGDDAGIVCRSRLAWALWCLGYPDQGLTQSQEALTLAQQSMYAYTLAHTWCAAATSQQFRREVPAVQERAEAAISLAEEQGFLYCMAQGAMLRGWMLAQQGQAEEGIEQFAQGLRDYRATGAEVMQPYFLALLAEAHATLGEPEAGLRVLTEALTRVDTTGERWYESELYRLKGALLMQQSSDYQAEAETCFQHALEIARSQQAKSFELRTATSLARLWQSQGKRQEAHALLAPVYDWFTEGFDTADLQDAKALLEELA